MDDDVKDKLEDLEKQLTIVNENINSRLDFVKWYVSGVAGIVGLLFAGVSVVFTINYNADRSAFNTQIGRGMDELKEFRETTKDYIKDKLGVSGEAKIEFFGRNKLFLDNQAITPDISTFKSSPSQPFWLVNIPFFIKNSGNALSGPLYFKMYFSTPFVTRNPSSDEPKYEYEHLWNPDRIGSSKGGLDRRASLKRCDGSVCFYHAAVAHGLF